MMGKPYNKVYFLTKDKIGDFVACKQCHAIQVVPENTDKCLVCRAKGSLLWVSVNYTKVTMDFIETISEVVVTTAKYT